MDIKKAFDSLDHKFLIYALEKYGLGKSFYRFFSLVKILLRNHEPCLLNDGNITKCFLLGRGARQDDTISAYFFVLALEILFQLIKSKPDIKGLTIFNHCYLYSAYPDDTTFFLQDAISIKRMVDVFFYLFCIFLD